MARKNNNLNLKDYKFMKLAYEQAKINLGSTSSNPSVGCVIVKNNSIIASGRTAFNGRPHAEADALKNKINYKNSQLYVTLEPCSHHGLTPPCVNKIINKKIKKVFFSTNDTDLRSKNLAYRNLKKKGVSVKRFLLKNYATKFYKSYFLQSSSHLPLIDAKLAISKDCKTINIKNKWITNSRSRRVGNFLRSKYDCVVSTAKTINKDNPSLNCRIKGLEKKSPAVVIIDRSFKIKKNLNIFKIKSREIFIFTQKLNRGKQKYFKKIGVNIIKLNKKKDPKEEFLEIYFFLKQLGFNRILIESGLRYTNELLRHHLISNFYLFKSFAASTSYYKNNTKTNLVRNLKVTSKNKINVNLNDDSLYKIEL